MSVLSMASNIWNHFLNSLRYIRFLCYLVIFFFYYFGEGAVVRYEMFIDIRTEGSCVRCMKSQWLSSFEMDTANRVQSWKRLFAFYKALILLGKVRIQLFSLQQWVNCRADWVLKPWEGKLNSNLFKNWPCIASCSGGGVG